MKLARLLLRLLMGVLFFGHGTQKLFGWFGGAGLDRTARFFDSIGARPGRVNAIAVGAAESAGGALLAVGFATPLAASGLIGTMLTAVKRVHLTKGLWVSGDGYAGGGYEYNLVVIAALLALVEAGPGPVSFDGDRHCGTGWALASLLAGSAGAVGAAAFSGRLVLPVEAAVTPV